MIKIRLILTFFVLLMTLIGPGFGQGGNALQVSGSQSETIHLNLAELCSLAQTKFVTSTIWSSAEIHFSGVSLKALLKHLQSKGNNIEMKALDGDVVSMPIADLEDNAPIISTRLNG